MMALPSQASNQKLARLPLKTGQTAIVKMLFSILFVAAGIVLAQEEPLGNEEHEREELGVNPYTAPSIALIFKQLDELKPFPFERLKQSG
jgi:hypothetical protein